MGAPTLLPETAVLLNAGSLRREADFILHDGMDAPSASRRSLVLRAFLAALDRVGAGAIIYVKSNMTDDFFAAAWPRIKARFVLVTAEADWAAPSHHRACLDDPRLIRWFGQNCDLPSPHPKFEPLPLGFAEPDQPHGEQAAMLRVHRCMPAVADKPLMAHASFHLTLSHPERIDVAQRLAGTPGLVFESRRIPPELLWIRHANYSFEISPRGAGHDCHRTWEALLLRTIPIVQKSLVDPVYEAFPVVSVGDWREVTIASMATWRAELSARFDAAMFERLTAAYWIARIRAAARVETGGRPF